MQRDEQGERFAFARFVREHCVLSREQFLKSFPCPLLLQHTEPGGRASDADTTPTFGTLSVRRELTLGLQPLWVYEVKKRGANPFMKMVTVGRAPNNDIVLPYDEISKFHGFLLEMPSGWMLADASSTNGTFLDGQRLEPNKPVPISFGSGAAGISMRFGGVRMSLHAPGRLWDHVAGMKSIALLAG